MTSNSFIAAPKRRCSEQRAALLGCTRRRRPPPPSCAESAWSGRGKGRGQPSQTPGGPTMGAGGQREGSHPSAALRSWGDWHKRNEQNNSGASWSWPCSLLFRVARMGAHARPTWGMERQTRRQATLVRQRGRQRGRHARITAEGLKNTSAAQGAQSGCWDFVINAFCCCPDSLCADIARFRTLPDVDPDIQTPVLLQLGEVKPAPSKPWSFPSYVTGPKGSQTAPGARGPEK